jgi:hypothetical protein
MVDFHAFSLPLVIDASSNHVQLGIPRKNDWLAIRENTGLAMQGIFEACHQLFADRDVSLREVDALLYCCGPGSTLGLRIAATFCKTILWESEGKVPFFQYNAMDLSALLLHPVDAPIQAPFRSRRRLLRQPGTSPLGKIEILEQEDALAQAASCYHLPDPRPIKFDIPEGQLLNYDLSQVNGLEDLSKISTAMSGPVPYSPEDVEFKKWDGQITSRN